MSFAEHLKRADDLIALELRPPRADLDTPRSMDSWFAMQSALRRAAAPGRVVFLTDRAVGSNEEESLHHLLANLPEETPSDLICPILTTKHTLEYCLWFAARAVMAGLPGLTVLGGDREIGPPRCVPHGYLLRRMIRERHPGLPLGGWANPHADPSRQVEHLLAPEATVDFYLTQIVTHYDLAPAVRLADQAERSGLGIPAVYGVFYWRSGNLRTLRRLMDFFPVPVEGLAADFTRGVSADEICARTIRALFAEGIRRIYVSNLDPNDAPHRLAAIISRL